MIVKIGEYNDKYQINVWHYYEADQIHMAGNFMEECKVDEESFHYLETEVPAYTYDIGNYSHALLADHLEEGAKREVSVIKICKDDKEFFITFDAVAYILNENGKTIDKI